jgi:hypothetical protein
MREDDEKRPPLPQLGSTPAPTEKPDLKRRILESKQRILSGMKGRYTGEETSRWLTSIEENSSNAEETISVGSLVDESRLSMPALLDLLFDHLQRYSFELNKVAADPDMKINCERPTSWQEKVEYFNKIRYMRGHLSTRYWSFIVWADETKADGYLLPTDFLVGFAPNNDFAPYITISRLSGGGDDIVWGIEKKVLSSSEVPKLARRLITHLVKVCTGESSSDEKFSFSTTETVVQPQVVPDRSYEFELEGQNEFQSDGGPAESRSQRLRRLMDDSARQEEADKAANIGFAKRPATVAERPPFDSGTFSAPGNGRGTTSSTSNPLPSVQGQTPTFQGFVPPGQTALPTPPGALGQPISPGSMGQPGGLPTPPGALAQPPGSPLTPPSGFGMPGAPPGLQAPTMQPPAGPPTVLQPPGGLSLGPPPGFGDGAPPSALMGGAAFGGLSSERNPVVPPGALSSERNPVVPPGMLSSERNPVVPPGALSSERNPVVPPGMLSSERNPVVPPGLLSSERNPVLPPAPAAAAQPTPGPTDTSESTGALRSPGALFAAPVNPERGRINSALLPEESGMYQAVSSGERSGEPELTSPWANLKNDGSDSPEARVSKPSLSDVTRPAAVDAAAAEAAAPPVRPSTPPPLPTPSAPQAPPSPFAPPPPAPVFAAPPAPPPTPVAAPLPETEPEVEAELEAPAEPEEPEAPSEPEAEKAYEYDAQEPAPVVADVAPEPPSPAAPVEVSTQPPAPAEPPKGLAGLVRKAILHDSAPPSPRKEGRAVQVDFGSPEDDEPAAAPAQAPVANVGRHPTLQSLLKPHDEPPADPPVSSNPDDISKLVNDAQQNALGNLSNIISELDRAMKSLQEAGVEAMQSGNFESVQLVMENTKRLKATKDRLSHLLDEISGI